MTYQYIPDPVLRTGAEEQAYLLKRAEYHRQRGESSPEPSARSIHERLQQLYEERAASAVMVLPD